MTDTVESLRAELDLLKADFNTFKEYAKPVVDSHQNITVPKLVDARLLVGPPRITPIPTE